MSLGLRFLSNQLIYDHVVDADMSITFLMVDYYFTFFVRNL